MDKDLRGCQQVSTKIRGEGLTQSSGVSLGPKILSERGTASDNELSRTTYTKQLSSLAAGWIDTYAS
jgi:hypothetical protein